VKTNLSSITLLAAGLLWACGDGPTSDAPRLTAMRGGLGRPAVLVDPNANEAGTARTIQQGIDMAAEGGKVLVLPGTYPEAPTISKGLTLEAVGGSPVIVEPPGAPAGAIEVVTRDPVTMRGLTVRYSGVNGVLAEGLVDVTLERVSVIAVGTPLTGFVHNVRASNDARETGARAHLVVRGSFLEGGVSGTAVPPFSQTFGISAQGDVDVLAEHNVIRRTGGACVFIILRSDLAGETNADILDNDFDQCLPAGRAGEILIGAAAQNVPSATLPVTATGVVSIVGKTFRNSTASCLTTSAINFESLGGRIEHNRFLDVVQDCASPTGRVLPAAIWLGAIRPFIPPVNVLVRFNDIVGNAQAGLRVGPNQGSPIDASCNYWGAADGPSGAGPGRGDAVVVEAGAATPSFTPFATIPIAETGATGC
jgi:hypothetical protein